MIRPDVDTGIVIVRQLGQAEDADDTNDGASVVDLQDFPGYRVMLVCGTDAWTDGAFTFSMRQSAAADMSNDAALAPISGSLAAVGAANTTRKACFRPTARYLRARCVAASTDAGAYIRALIVLVPPYGSV